MSKKAGYYVSQIDRRVASLSGHVMLFKAGEEKYVPQPARKEMLEMGIMPADGKGEEQKTEDKKADEKTDADRAEKLAATLVDIAKRNDSDDFTAGQVPKVKAVSDALGFAVTQKEVTDAWQENRKAAGNT